MEDRCRTQLNDCESGCEDKNQMTANSRKHPSNRDELDTPRCRDACRVNADACTRSTQAQCPAPCAQGQGPESAPPATL